MAEEEQESVGVVPWGLEDVKKIGVVRPKNYHDKISDKALAAAKTIPQLPVRENGIFRHPTDWTPEEDMVIAAGLRAHLPLAVIATKVNCERNALSKHIKNTPDLHTLQLDMREDLIDRGEYEIDRLMKAGNPSAVMFVLERLGRKRGWGQSEIAEETKTENERLVIGGISDEELAAADSEIIAKGGTVESEVFVSNPMEMEKAAERAADDTTTMESTTKSSASEGEVVAAVEGGYVASNDDNSELSGYGMDVGGGDFAGFDGPDDSPFSM